MQSLTMIREIAHSIPKTISGVSSLALTTSTDLNQHSSILVTYPSLPRLCATVKPLTSSSNIRKKYARLKNACGKPASSKTQVGVGWKEPMPYTGLKRHW